VVSSFPAIGGLPTVEAELQFVFGPDRGTARHWRLRLHLLVLGGSRRAAAKECLDLIQRNLPVLIGVDRFEDFSMGCLDFLK
jgi:hypothetical protein